MASIFFNFGTDGSSAGEKTYYFDDVWFGSPPNTVNLEECVWNNNKQNIVVFPNPTKENINIQTLNYNGIVETQLFDILGNNIINSCSRNLSLKDLKKGVYILRISYDGNLSEIKIIKN